MSFLRKQESRLFCAWPLVISAEVRIQKTLGSRLRGNDTMGLARQGRGDLLHTAK